MLYDIDGSFGYKGEDKAYQMASALVTLVLVLSDVVKNDLELIAYATRALKRVSKYVIKIQ